MLTYSANVMASVAQHRVKMWLKAERAMGLESVVGATAKRAVASVNRASSNINRAMTQTIPTRTSRTDAARLPQVAPVEPSSVGRPGTRVSSHAAGSKDNATARHDVAARVGTPGASKPASPVIPGFSLFGSPAPVAPVLVIPVNEPFTAPILSRDQKIAALRAMDDDEVKGCTRCRLCGGRTNTVFGEGDPDARIVFIGEGPGENEDIEGRPFVGRSGNLLNGMISGMGVSREQVFIANIVKCRPPENREPMPDEVATCTPYLQRQLEIVRPKVIITLGKPAIHHLLQTKLALNKLRGQWQMWRGIKVMPTYHPAYVLRNYTNETRAAVWSDLQQVMSELGLTAPNKEKKA